MVASWGFARGLYGYLVDANTQHRVWFWGAKPLARGLTRYSCSGHRPYHVLIPLSSTLLVVSLLAKPPSPKGSPPLGSKGTGPSRGQPEKKSGTIRPTKKKISLPMGSITRAGNRADGQAQAAQEEGQTASTTKEQAAYRQHLCCNSCCLWCNLCCFCCLCCNLSCLRCLYCLRCNLCNHCCICYLCPHSCHPRCLRHTLCCCPCIFPCCSSHLFSRGCFSDLLPNMVKHPLLANH